MRASDNVHAERPKPDTPISDHLKPVLSNFHALGNRVSAFVGFDTFDRPSQTFRVVMTSDEVTALCPVTGQPDQYTVTVEYFPNECCLESKSLKLYLQSFRNTGAFVEALATLIADDIAGVLDCPVYVTIVQKARGGIAITAEAHAAPAPDPLPEGEHDRG